MSSILLRDTRQESRELLNKNSIFQDILYKYFIYIKNIYFTHLQKKGFGTASKALLVVLKAVLACLQCVMACFERFMKFINVNAYIETGQCVSV